MSNARGDKNGQRKWRMVASRIRSRKKRNKTTKRLLRKLHRKNSGGEVTAEAPEGACFSRGTASKEVLSRGTVKGGRVGQRPRLKAREGTKWKKGAPVSFEHSGRELY